MNTVNNNPYLVVISQQSSATNHTQIDDRRPPTEVGGVSSAVTQSGGVEQIPDDVDVDDDRNASPERPPLTQDIAFEMLSCRRRRDVLHYLRQHDGTEKLNPLSRQIAAWENDVPAEEVTYQERIRVYTALRQSHLPKLDAAGIVTFDPDRGSVSLTDQASELDVYLDVVPHDDISWSQYYVGLSGLSAAFAVLALLGVFPFGLLPSGGAALVIAVLFLGSALAHRSYDQQMRVGSGERPPETGE